MLLLIEFCRDTSRWINDCEIVFETVHTVIVSCVKICIETRHFTENFFHSVFTSVKTMGNFQSDSHSTLYVNRCTRTRSHIKSKNGAEIYNTKQQRARTRCIVRWRWCGSRRENRLWSVVLRGKSSWASWSVVVVRLHKWSIILLGLRLQSSVVVRN